jgi:DnaJ-domain-containing protein 1
MAAFVLGLSTLIAFLGAAWWFSRQDSEHAARMVRIILGGGATLAGVVLSLRGALPLGVPIGLFGLGILGAAFRVPGAAQDDAPPPRPPIPSMSLRDAREVLGVDEHADQAAIRQAHRSLMKKLHPDTGEGSAALARQVQSARDLLLEHLSSQK